MTIWPISIKESNIIYDSLIELTNYLKDEKSVEMVFVHINEFTKYNITNGEEITKNDFVVNILCNDKDKFNNSQAFEYIKNIQNSIDDTFIYLSVWNNDSDTINCDMFKKFFSRSCIIIEKNESTKYYNMWEKLQTDPTIPYRPTFYVDLPMQNQLTRKDINGVTKQFCEKNKKQ